MSKEIIDSYQTAPDKYDPLAEHPDPNKLYLDSLSQGTLLAGREKPFNWELDDITSEAALHRYRAMVEIEALINLAERGPAAIEISSADKLVLRSLYDRDHFDSNIVIQLDHLGYGGRPPLEHDVKAVEVYLGELMDSYNLGHLKEWVHFGMTSEDTNNLAYNHMLRDAMNQVVIPSVTRVADRLAHLSTTYAETPTLGVTHAQKASPTTVGKQFGYHLAKMTQVMADLDGMRLTGKFSGAVGNHNPMPVVFPDFDYDAYAQDFVEAQGFDYSPIENQRNNHLAVAKLLDILQTLAITGKDTATNIWLQINDAKLKQKLVEGERGSSTMAHKINPWRLENAESLLEQAIALSGGAKDGLVSSRHERDLSDHDWQRAYGDMIGRIVTAFNYMAVQLDRLAVDTTQTSKDLSGAAEVLSELGQTAGRASGDPDAYDKLVERTQGKKVDLNQMRYALKASMPDSELRDRVLDITPETYVGIAPELAKKAVLGWHGLKTVLLRGTLDSAKSVDAVFFDLDDTLHFGIKDELIARVTAVTSALDMELTPEELATYAKMHDYKKMVEAIINMHNARSPHSIVSPEAYDATNKTFSGLFDDRFKPHPSGLSVIQSVRDSDKKTGLVTTRGDVSLGRVLQLHGLSDAFDTIVSGGSAIKRRKPHPEPLLTAANNLGLAPERILYVGDDQDADIGAAKAAGMKSALVKEGELDPLGPQPDHHWQSLEEVARRYAR